MGRWEQGVLLKTIQNIISDFGQQRATMFVINVIIGLVLPDCAILFPDD